MAVFEPEGVHRCGLEPKAVDRPDRCDAQNDRCQAHPGEVNRVDVSTNFKRELGSSVFERVEDHLQLIRRKRRTADQLARPHAIPPTTLI
jgi:hypothetical protein